MPVGIHLANGLIVLNYVLRLTLYCLLHLRLHSQKSSPTIARSIHPVNSTSETLVMRCTLDLDATKILDGCEPLLSRNKATGCFTYEWYPKDRSGAVTSTSYSTNSSPIATTILTILFPFPLCPIQFQLARRPLQPKTLPPNLLCRLCLHRL